MTNKIAKELIPFLAIAAFLTPVFLPSCANTTKAPSGGDRDTIPPFIVNISPLPGATNVPVKGSQIVFTFNEYVSVRNQANILLSPPQTKRPKYKIKGKSVVISFEEDLLSNQCYTLTIDNAIADCNENNMFEGFTYAFSTGPVIDSMMISGTVMNSTDLKPAKDISVMLYRNASDSAAIISAPDYMAKTDDWGYFVLPYIQDTIYRIYAIKDEDGNNRYSPSTDMIAFHTEGIKPVKKVSKECPELLKYDMKDTVACLARQSEYELVLFQDEKAAQFLRETGRPSSKSAFVTFNAPNVEIDSIWISGISADKLITCFNERRDSLSIWINDKRQLPDTLNLFVNYMMTDSLDKFVPETQHKKLFFKHIHKRQRELTAADTTCSLTISCQADNVDKTGIFFEFGAPIIYENFNLVKLNVTNARQRTTEEKFTFEIDSLNLRRFIVKPENPIMPSCDYQIVVPHHAFRDIYGNYTDSTKFKYSLSELKNPSSITIHVKNVKGQRIIDLVTSKSETAVRSCVINSDTTVVFKYLKEGNYSIRISCDDNGNGRIDTGSFFEHRLPERVYVYKKNNRSEIAIPKGSDIDQTIFID